MHQGGLFHIRGILFLVLLLAALPIAAAERYYLLGLRSGAGQFEVDYLKVEDVQGSIEQPNGGRYTVSVLSQTRQKLSSSAYDLTVPELLLLYIPYQEAGARIVITDNRQNVLLDVPIEAYLNAPKREATVQKSAESSGGSAQQPKSAEVPDATQKQEAPQENGSRFWRVFNIALVFILLGIISMFFWKRSREQQERLHRIRSYVHHHSKRGHPFRNIHHTLKHHGVEDHEIRTALRMKSKKS